MSILVVVNNKADWPLEIPDVEVISARRYLTDPSSSRSRGTKVFNLCKSYRYQSLGYYVSLLAAARGHRAIPSISTVQEMKSQTITRFVSEDLEELLEREFQHIKSDRFVLSIYFGRNVAKKYDRLAKHIFNEFEAPFLRAVFQRSEDGWDLQHVSPIPASEIPEEHRPFVIDAAREYFSGRRNLSVKKNKSRYNLAILHNPDEKEPPSNPKALERFIKAGQQFDLEVDLIEKDDYGKVAEFDALFIRETTSVNHHTFRFAQRAEAEGLVVIDDPESILRCTNKVFLSESLERHKLPAPRTMIVHKDNVDGIPPTLGFPCILKQPDSAFSVGVEKVDRAEELDGAVQRLLEKSELIVAQEWLPTTFDWRVGVWDGEALFVCKYFMAKRHWQIIQRDGDGKANYGKSETIPVEMAPRKLVRLAEKAAGLVGKGLYGVDIKEANGKYYVIEVNDNPNIDAGTEDATLKDKLYTTIMRGFLERIERHKERGV
ncbi:MAG: RimK family protein [Myxococcota bacterium]